MIYKIGKMELREYIDGIKSRLKDENWYKANKETESLINDFNASYDKLLSNKEKLNIISELKREFDEIVINFKNKKRIYYKNLELKRKDNLNAKLKIIEEIKELITINESLSSVYRKFKDLQRKWYTLGSVSIIERTNIWETFKHHTERFYNFLHLNRELKEIDYKRNYNEKIKIIQKAKFLAESSDKDIIKTMRELNDLHRLWKNELGPVDGKHTNELWKRFQESSHFIHSKKNIYNKNKEKIEKENLIKKNQILIRLNEINELDDLNYNSWQKITNELSLLKTSFLSIGRIPKKENRINWEKYRLFFKEINKKKIKFYKSHKKKIDEIVLFKKRLIHQVKEIIDSENLKNKASRVKGIQKEWKNTEQIPKKISDKLWSEFNDLCNKFFLMIKDINHIDSNQHVQVLNEVNIFCNNLKFSQKNPIEKDYHDFILKSIVSSKNKLSQSIPIKKTINKQLIKYFNEIIDNSKFNTEVKNSIKHKTKLLMIQDDNEELDKEYNSTLKEINHIKNNLIQLQNNLEFFTKSSEKTPMFIEVFNKIELLNSDLLAFYEKKKRIKKIINTYNDKIVNQEKITSD